MSVSDWAGAVSDWRDALEDMKGLIAPVFRSTLPEQERLSVPQLIDDLKAAGQSAAAPASLDEIVEIIVNRHTRGDVAVLMSNGGFGGLHTRLLERLGRGA